MPDLWSLEFLNFVTNQLPLAIPIEDPKSECDDAKSDLNELTEEILIDSQSENLTKYHEPPVQSNFADESLDCDRRENEILPLDLHEENKQCRRFEIKLEAGTGDVTKANELLNAEKMFRSKVETERDSLAWLAEKLKLIVLKYNQHFSSSENITLCSSKMTHHWDLKNLNSVTHQLPFDVQIKEPKSECDSVKTEITEEILIEPRLEDLTEHYEPSLQNHFADESFYCDNRDKKMANEQCRRLKIEFETVNEKLTKMNESLNAEKKFRSQTEIDRDSLAHLVEKLELILFKYDQHFSSTGKMEESSEFLDVKFTNEFDLKIDYESDTDPLLESSRPALITIVKDEIAEDVDRMDMVSLSSTKRNYSRSLTSPNIVNNKIGDEIDGTGANKPTNFNKDSGFHCAHCDKKFSRKFNLISHIRARHLPRLEKPYKCTTCNESFVRKYNLDRHQAVHIPSHKRVQQCNICKRNFSSKNGLWSHKRIVHDGIKPYRCTECDKAFDEKSKLKKHQSAHSFQRPFSCSTCNKSFKTARQRDTHESIIHGDGGIYCAHCNRKFGGKRDIIHHMAKHIPELGEQYLCKTCGKVFIYKSSFSRHLRAHLKTKTRPYVRERVQCDTGRKYNASKTSLQSHKCLMPNRIKHFKCSECMKTFATKSNLEEHASVHTSQRLFQCSICDRRFKSARTKDQHENFVHGNSGFHCAHCDRKFFRKRDLISHLTTRHLPGMSRLFKCATCDKSFLRKQELNRHQAVHSKVSSAYQKK